MYHVKFLIESTCPVCGKLFIPAPQHAYSVNVHKKNGYTKKVPICSWSCLRAHEKGAKLHDCE